MLELRPLLNRLDLPEAYAGFVSLYLQPVADILDQRIREHRTSLIGINGSQGSGKSTAASFLKLLLEYGHGHRTVVLSIDDFYLPRAGRQAMARNVHPLFATRGVPGTHDVMLALDTLNALKKAGSGDSVEIPRFDKATDDRVPRGAWESITGPVSAIILEGWCVGAPPLDEATLTLPVNELERTEDTDGLWRRTVCEHLAGEYQLLFATIDWLLMLRAPGFDVVHDWRRKQEEKLAPAENPGEDLLDEAQLTRFIQHYQRLTEHCLERIPGTADAVITLDEAQRMTGLEVRRP